jgi:hypothetical protein
MSDRFVVSMNLISKGLKSGCRKNSVYISCALNTKITILTLELLFVKDYDNMLLETQKS